MSRGKYLSLEEARKLKQLDRFAKEHPSKGDRALFDRLFSAMVKMPAKAGRLLNRKTSADCTDTQTR
jgi:hypothetical protein